MRLAAIETVDPPAELPVGVPEFVDHARLNGITVDRQEDLLERELAAATRRAERFLRRSIMTQTLKALYYPDGKDCRCGQLLALPRGNVQSVESVTGQYGALEYTQEFNAVVLAAPATGPVTVVWISGYGDDPAAVPDTVREGILEYAMTLYEDRAGARESRYASGGDGVPKGVRDLWRSEQLEV